MATVSDLGTKIRALLDDDSTTSPRYSYDKDIIPAMNSAIDYLVAVFSAGFDSKQIKPEVLHNLIKAKSLSVTDINGSVARIEVPVEVGWSYDADVWKVIGVTPNADTGAGGVYNIGKTAGRLTIEQWDHASENPFAHGSAITVPADLASAGYIGPGKYAGDGTKDYILFRPADLIEDSTVALIYLRPPTALTTSSSVIEFPVTVHGFIVQKTLYYLTYQHSKDTKYLGITDKEVKELIQLIAA